MTPEEAKARAQDAKRLLDDPLLKETFAVAQEALIKAIELAKTETEFYKAGLALQVFKLIRDSLTSHIETAKVIEFNFKDRNLLDRITGR